MRLGNRIFMVKRRSRVDRREALQSGSEVGKSRIGQAVHEAELCEHNKERVREGGKHGRSMARVALSGTCCCGRGPRNVCVTDQKNHESITRIHTRW